MRILWFTNTPSKAAVDFGYKSFGGGWISSLESLMVAEGIHELGICFFYNGKDFKKIIKDKVVYYGMPFEQEGLFKKIISRHCGNLNDNHGPYVDSIIKDFNPDLIHVFGTEQSYGKLLINKFDKVVFHLQGLVMPLSKVYFPGEFPRKKVLWKSGIKDMLRGVTFYHSHLLLKKKASREVEILNHWKYFTGRTDYDRNYVKLINPSITYFHCEELLRGEFFLDQWTALQKPGINKTIIIGTTINPNIYKGLDVIYRVLKLLKGYTICWKIFGITEDRDLNIMVKKMLNIKEAEPALKFYGPLSAPKLIEELKTCHFFVHPSYADNSPNSVCEAMLLGMPVISSSVGGVKSLITHKENGFLFNPGDPFELAGLLIHLANNYDIALNGAKKARETALKRHSSEGIMNTLNKIYSAIHQG